MIVLQLVAFIVAVSGYRSQRHRYRSNRLIDQDAVAAARDDYYDFHDHYYAPYGQVQSAPAYGDHRRDSLSKAQPLMDELQVLEQELRALRRARHHAQRAYEDVYEDEIDAEFEMEDATAIWLGGQANGKVSEDTSHLFREAPVAKTLEVKWPGKAWSHFHWHDYLANVDSGALTQEQEQSVYGVGGLRLLTLKELLKASCASAGLEASEACFVNLGSDTAKSDLDFTYIRWEEPTKVVKSLVEYYNLFYAIFNGWPLDVFDMNFYIANGFIKDTAAGKCYTALNQESNAVMVGLFTQIYKGDSSAWYELASPGAYNDKRFAVYDRYLAYLLISRRFSEGFDEPVDKDDEEFMALLKAGPADGKIVHLLQYAHVFYLHLEQIRAAGGRFAYWKTPSNRQTDLLFDRTKIFLKTLLYLMNYWSDESYVSNEALQLIFNKGVDAVDDKRKYLAVLDNLAFVHKYAHEHDTDLLGYWDRASKYMFRVCKLLNLADDFKLWTKKSKKDKRTGEKREYDELWKRLNQNDEREWSEENVKTFNLARLALFWQRKWPKVEGNENGEHKIRGDIPFVYLIELDKDIDAKHNSKWFQTTLPIARSIWTQIKTRFKDTAALQHWMTTLRRHLDADVFFVPMPITLSTGAKSDVKLFLKTVYNRVQKMVGKFVGGAIKIVPNEKSSAVSFSNPAKKIVYGGIDKKELAKAVPNPFNDKDIFSVLEPDI